MARTGCGGKRNNAGRPKGSKNKTTARLIAGTRKNNGSKTTARFIIGTRKSV